ncbi:MAG: helix-turn-helix domain-containing protein [Fimbriiglobus sp.]
MLVPDSLHDAAWLQLAAAVAGDNTFRRCPGCAKWVEVSADRGRANQWYCGAACRAKAYRRRQAEAVRMAAAGDTPEAIAAALGTDPDTVRGWIKRN